MKVKRCSSCEEEIDGCEVCGKTFEAGDEIICTPDFMHGGIYVHFCSEECFQGWLADNGYCEVAEVIEGEEE